VEAAAASQPRPRPLLLRLVTVKRVLLLVLAVALVFALLARLNSGDDIFLPDRAHPVAPLVHVQGGHDPKNGGGIYYVDVFIRPATVLEKLFGGLHSGADLVPVSEVNGPGVSNAQEAQVGAFEMKTSQQVAAAVALRALGKKVTITDGGALVDEVQPGYPAYHKLDPADVIVAVDGKGVGSPAGVFKAMSGKPVGSSFVFTVLRAGKRHAVVLKTVPDKAGSKRGIVGIYLDPSDYATIHLPIKVSIDAHDVGGPSAGLAFALEVLQQLGRNVDHGNKIAATGEIYLNGHVGAIGGIKQKTIGAREAGVDAFLVPKANAATARKYADGLRIIPVQNFQQALHALATLPPKG
jgi:PDZ domain-containing protein